MTLAPGRGRGCWVLETGEGSGHAWAGGWGQPGDNKDKDSMSWCPRCCSIPRTASAWDDGEARMQRSNRRRVQKGGKSDVGDDGDIGAASSVPCG